MWIFAEQVGTAIAGLFGVKLLTNILGPSEFGIFILANTVVVLVSVNFLFGPLGLGLMRFWSISQSRGDLGAFYAVSRMLEKYVIIISIIVATVLVIISVNIKGRNWGILMAFSMMAGITSGCLVLRLFVFTAARKRKWVSLLNIGKAVLKPLIAAGFILLINKNATWAMVGYLVATFIIMLLAEHFYNCIVSNTIYSTLTKNNNLSSIKKDIISFSWPFAMWGIFNWIYVSCDKWALQAYHGVEVVGAFSVVSQLAIYSLVYSYNFLNNLFVPIAFQRAGDLNNNQNIISANKILVIMTIIYILGTIILILLFSVFHYPLVLLISNIQFADLSFLLPWLTFAWSLFYIGQILSNFGMLANQPQVYIMPKIVSAIVAGICTFYLSNKIGSTGVVYGLIIAGIIYSLWCGIIAVEYYKRGKVSFSDGSNI